MSMEHIPLLWVGIAVAAAVAGAVAGAVEAVAGEAFAGSAAVAVVGEAADG